MKKIFIICISIIFYYVCSSLMMTYYILKLSCFIRKFFITFIIEIFIKLLIYIFRYGFPDYLDISKLIFFLCFICSINKNRAFFMNYRMLDFLKKISASPFNFSTISFKFSSLNKFFKYIV